ncbi:MAG: hypothetical protein Q7T96_01850 [Methylobacter sp.]|nr:hypothetical protein [Methylobacter sp.]
MKSNRSPQLISSTVSSLGKKRGKFVIFVSKQGNNFDRVDLLIAYSAKGHHCESVLTFDKRLQNLLALS